MKRIERHAPKVRLVAAFAAIYLIWGSTYLAIRFAIETVPPLLMMGTRALLAGTAIYVFARQRGGERPSLQQWRCAALAGSLLFLVGHGGLAWAEQRMASGPAALISATSPLWMILIAMLMERRRELSRRLLIGLALGVGGVVLLAKPGELLGGAPLDLVAVAVLLVADVSWAAGSIYSRNAGFPRSPALTAGMTMLAGGAALVLVSLASGEARTLGSVSTRSLAALLYLVVFGSVIGFAAYTWLLRVTSPARVSTHAFVNPVVALLAGWMVGGEVLDARTATAALIMVGGAAAIVTDRAAPGADPLKANPETCGGCETLVAGPGGINPCCECQPEPAVVLRSSTLPIVERMDQAVAG
ncbi:MAG TPA: EamA family transporter [Gemmatimonadota bacterium]|nr:EamA family transporter [Gemmatimonadota bacterium]